MTDEELIRWLREQSMHCFRNNALGAQVYVDAVADRLEELTAPALPPGKRPVTWVREAEIRALPNPRLDTRDLLALLDHERRRGDELESMVANTFDDSNVARIAEAAGVAKALAVVRDRDKLGTTPGTLYPLTVGESNLLRQVCGRIEEVCGPAQLPPHAATLAACERMRSALLEIMAVYREPNTNVRDDWQKMNQIARAALAEEDAE